MRVKLISAATILVASVALTGCVNNTPSPTPSASEAPTQPVVTGPLTLSTDLTAVESVTPGWTQTTAPVPESVSLQQAIYSNSNNTCQFTATSQLMPYDEALADYQPASTAEEKDASIKTMRDQIFPDDPNAAPEDLREIQVKTSDGKTVTLEAGTFNPASYFDAQSSIRRSLYGTPHTTVLAVKVFSDKFSIVVDNSAGTDADRSDDAASVPATSTYEVFPSVVLKYSCDTTDYSPEAFNALVANTVVNIPTK